MYAQCDIHSNQYWLIEGLVDHQADETAVKFANQFIVIRGCKHMHKMTIGWSFCIQWKNSKTSWERLSNFKESNPIKVAEYAVALGINHEPVFSWWVPLVLKKRDRIISAVISIIISACTNLVSKS
jgi:hypothetical protein